MKARLENIKVSVGEKQLKIGEPRSLLAITLTLLEKNSDYDELVMACRPIWDANNSLTKSTGDRLAEYADWMSRVGGTHGSTGTLTEDQEQEFDHLDSLLQDESFIFHTSRNGLMWALILVISKLMAKDFQIAARTLDHISPSFEKLNWNDKIIRIYSLGLKVKTEPWAMCVRAASNYIRHSDEWYVKTIRSEVISGVKVSRKITEPLVNQLSPQQQPSAKSLVAIGIPEADLLSRSKDQSHPVCELLGLLEENQVTNFYLEWNAALTSYMKSQEGR